MTVSIESKSLWEKGRQILHKTVYKYLGMVDKPDRLVRNIIGAFLVTLPELPTYFIPAYTQAKATGDAKDIKKSEGARGLLTGALEGLAVGAILGNDELGFKHAAPFVLFGAAMQLISSKVFPIVGEKLGVLMYNKNAVCQCSEVKPQQNPDPDKNTKAKLDVVSQAPNIAPIEPEFKLLQQNNTPVNQINTSITKPGINNPNLKV